MVPATELAGAVAGQRKRGHRLLAGWRDLVAGKGVRVALADGEDIRALRAAVELHAQGVIAPRLVGHLGRVYALARSAGLNLAEELVLDTANSPRIPLCALRCTPRS